MAWQKAREKVSAAPTSIEHMFDERGGDTRLGAARAALAAAESKLGISPNARGKIGLFEGTRADLYRSAARAQGEAAWCTMIALPDVGWECASACGMALERVIYLPDVTGAAASVLAACIDAVDVIVAGPLELTPSQARRLSARAFVRGVTVLATSPWPGVASGEQVG